MCISLTTNTRAKLAQPLPSPVSLDMAAGQPECLSLPRLLMMENLSETRQQACSVPRVTTTFALPMKKQCFPWWTLTWISNIASCWILMHNLDNSLSIRIYVGAHQRDHSCPNCPKFDNIFRHFYNHIETHHGVNILHVRTLMVFQLTEVVISVFTTFTFFI